jgi:hypothetical protein
MHSLQLFLSGQRHSAAANQTFWRVVDTNSQWLICKNIWMTPSVNLHIDFMCCPCLSMKACGVRQKGFSNEAIV